MAKVADISTKLSLNNRDFKKGLQATSKSIAKFHEGFKRAARRVAKAGALALAAATASIVAIVKSTTDSIDEVAKVSQKLGIPIEKLSALGHVADQTGVSVQNMQTGLQRMTRRISEAGLGTGVAVKALAELGIKTADIIDLSPDEQFLAIADAMENVHSQSDRVRLGFALFDTEGVALINTMAGGSDAILALMADAEALGLTFSQEHADMVIASKDATDRMTKSFKGMFNNITIALAPFTKHFADKMTEAIMAPDRSIDKTQNGILKMGKGLGVLGNAANLLKGTFQIAFGGIQFVIGGVLKGLDQAAIGIIRGLNWTIRQVMKIPGAKKLGIKELDANLEPIEFIEFVMRDAKKNVEAGKKALGRGARGAWANDLVSGMDEIITAGLPPKEMSDIDVLNEFQEMMDAQREKPVAKVDAAVPVAKAAVAKAAAGAAVVRPLEAHDSVRRLGNLADLYEESIMDFDKPAMNKSDLRFRRYSRLSGTEYRFRARKRKEELEKQLAAKDRQKGKAIEIERDKGKVLLEILASVNNIRDSKFISFAQ